MLLALPARDATIARLDGTNATLHLIIGARKILLIVALDKMGALVGEHLQKLL